MTTISFSALIRYEVTNDADYYYVMQYFDERDDLYNDLIKEAEGGFDIDELEMIQGEIDDVEKKITNIRKQYDKKRN